MVCQQFPENDPPANHNGMFNTLEECEQGCSPKGACCFPCPALCNNITAEECAAAGGDYRGDDTRCLDECAPIFGACCLSDGNCEQLQQCDCDFRGGTYKGNNTLCDECLPPGICGENTVNCVTATWEKDGDGPWYLRSYGSVGVMCRDVCGFYDSGVQCSTVTDENGVEFQRCSQGFSYGEPCLGPCPSPS